MITVEHFTRNYPAWKNNEYLFVKVQDINDLLSDGIAGFECVGDTEECQPGFFARCALRKIINIEAFGIQTVLNV